MRVLVDCDVIIDVAAGRAPFFNESRGVLDWCEQHPGSAFIAWHTISNLHYLTRKSIGGVAIRQFIQELLGFVEVVATGTAPAKHALVLPMTDFEDAMQAAAAVEAGVDFIVTRNVADYGNSPIPALLPSAFIAQAPA